MLTKTDSMLVKTDFYRNVRRAKITLQCNLRPSLYDRAPEMQHRKLQLALIAGILYDIEYNFINAAGNVTTTLSAVVPVGTNDPSEWLVVELTKVGSRNQSDSDWEDFVAQATAKIVSELALGGDDRIATVETGNSYFVVMDDITNGEASEPIDY